MSRKNKTDLEDNGTAEKITTADVTGGLADLEKIDQPDPDEEKKKPAKRDSDTAGHVFSGQ